MNSSFSTYVHCCQFLDTLGLFHMDFGLERVQKALIDLELTHPPFYSVQVVGTNGKGSTASFLERIAREHGLRTGLFTSPHFVGPKERICINGRALSEEKWPALAQKVHDTAPQLTYFEFLTVMATLAFTQEKIDFAVIEAGLGGHYDATTALHRDALCFTPISKDHEQILGNTVQAIATDKAQAIVAHKPVFMGEQNLKVSLIIEEVCHTRHAPLHKVTHELLPCLQDALLGLQGAHQKNNAALALTAWQHIAQEKNYNCEQEKIYTALNKTFIAGRLQHITCTEDCLPPTLLLDGAHNEAGLVKLLEYLTLSSVSPAVIIFSCLADKDLKTLLALLKKLHRLCNYCPLLITGMQHNERALNAVQRQSIAKDIGNNTFFFAHIQEALSHARALTMQNSQEQGPVLLCGSLYLLGEFYEKYPHYLYENHSS